MSKFRLTFGQSFDDEFSGDTLPCGDFMRVVEAPSREVAMDLARSMVGESIYERQWLSELKALEPCGDEELINPTDDMLWRKRREKKVSQNVQN
jgi:hypothetical protein